MQRLEVNCAVRRLYRSLGVKRLILHFTKIYIQPISVRKVPRLAI